MQANHKLPTRYKTIGETALGLVGWAVLGAAGGATAGGLCGVFCGVLGGLIHDELWPVASAGLYFTLRGAFAGALAGGFARMIDPEGVADLTSRSFNNAELMDPVVFGPKAHASSLLVRVQHASVRFTHWTNGQTRTDHIT